MLCLICYTALNKSYPKLICSCTFCIDCLSNWIQSQINCLFFTLENQIIKCPSSNCQNPYQLDELKKILKNKNVLSKIESALTIKYCQESSDIMSCPNSKCKSFGFLPKKCDFELKCNICKKKWVNYNNFTNIKKLKLFFNLENCFNYTFNFLSYSYEELFTNNCPNCQIPISKNGGCVHMTCLKCNFQFCWFCKKYWMWHNYLFCSSHLLSLISLFFFIFLLIINNLGFLSIISYYFYPFIRYIFLIFIYFDGAILGIIISLYLKINYIKANAKYISWPKKIIPPLIMGLIAILLFSSLFLFDLFWFFVKAILVEFTLCIMGFSIINIGGYVQTWISNVI